MCVRARVRVCACVSCVSVIIKLLGLVGCGVNSTNVESDCWVECFYRTILQEPKMNAAQLVSAWERAFQAGGCPSLPPYVPPSLNAF